ncbi:MAG: replicative DNA helicase, partial [Clostridia bacterium]|nr:replicative DNA helicase [Clostridia bacterium]
LCSQLHSDDFHSPIHQQIFDAMQNIVRKNQPVDYVTLVNELEKNQKLNEVGGINYITTLTNCVPAASNYQHYTDIVLECSKLRKLLEMGQSVVSKAYDGIDSKDVIQFIEKELTEIATNQQKQGLTHIADSVDNVTQKLQDIAQNPNTVTGLKTNFYGLDKILNGGLHKGDLVILAARPGVGKTTLAMNFVTNTAIKEKATVAVFSLEMPKEQLAQRALCSVAKVDMSNALSGKLEQEDWRALWEARKLLQDSNIYVDDASDVNTGLIISECRKLKRTKGLDLVMIDYLQLMSKDSKSGGKDDSRLQEISAMTRNLKIAAKELDVPIILLSQLSRSPEQRQDHRPMLADLRESGSIEQDADIVLFIYNPDVYKQDESPKPGIVDLMIAKHRNGSQGTVKLHFKREVCTFFSTNADANAGSFEDTLPKPKEEKNDVYVPADIMPMEQSGVIDDIFK